MLSNNHSFKKLNLLKKHKVEPIGAGNVSLDDLASLVKRLSVQVDDLVEENNQKKVNSPIDTAVVTAVPLSQSQPLMNQIQSPMEGYQQQQQPALPPLPMQQSNSTHTRQNSISQYIKPNNTNTFKPASHTTIDPWASYVPQNYGALLQRLDDIESLQKCPNECCASTGTVSSADGVPWPQPLEPFRNTSPTEQQQDVLDIQYTHWCTLLRCLPLMDPVTSAHVKTVGLYAMREILKIKASNKRDHEPLFINSTPIKSAHPIDATSTRLRDSMSFLNRTNTVGGLASTAPTATQDMPSWLTTSETKTALDVEAEAPIPPPKQSNESTTTPTPSSFPSPLYPHTGKRFQKWLQYKKIGKKSNTDTANTPLGQSQTLRKIGSWFF